MAISRRMILPCACMAFVMAVTCCGKAEITESSVVSEESSTITVTIPTETTDYVPGGDGYYSQLDNGIGTDVQDQGYTPDCWVYSSLDVMRITNQVINGEDLELSVEELKELAYGSKDEGLTLSEGSTVKGIAGGGEQYIVWVMSNGYNGYTVVENPYITGAYQEGDETMLVNSASREQIQEMLRDKGALPIYVKYGSGIINSDDLVYINDETGFEKYGDLIVPEDYLSHEALIVGWDDNFPKEYFGRYGKRMPSTDGAWLYKESGGTDWGNEGYAWMSYESTYVINGYIAVSDKYSKVLSYDNSVTMGINTGSETTAANVFHEGGKLSAVGTYVGYSDNFKEGFGMNDEDHTITIEIRDADLNEVLVSKTADFDFDGYYVVELDEPVEVEEFSVVITYHGNAPAEGETKYSVKAGLDYIINSEQGQSFVLVDGEWLDMTDDSIVDTLGLGEKPNNICIKALFED
ncbi:MAG: hypothetical protein K6G47_02005 [Clostridia bacterium]|nr:hypothetical protein [Clostridia bacterium]